MLNARKIGCAALLGVMLLGGCIADRQVEAGAETGTNHAAISDNQQQAAEQNNVALPDDQQQGIEPSNIDRITAYLEDYHAQQLQDELKRMEKIKGTWVVEELVLVPPLGLGAYHPEPERVAVGKYLIIDDEYNVTFADCEYWFDEAKVIQPSFMYDHCIRMQVDRILGEDILYLGVHIKAADSYLAFMLLQRKGGGLYVYSSESFDRTGLYSLKKVDNAIEK
jgi:hypothetical protein